MTFNKSWHFAGISCNINNYLPVELEKMGSLVNALASQLYLAEVKPSWTVKARMQHLKEHQLRNTYKKKVCCLQAAFNAGRHPDERVADTLDDLRQIAVNDPELSRYAISLLTITYLPGDREQHGQPAGPLQHLTEGDRELTIALLVDQRPNIPPDQQQLHHYCVIPMNNYQTYEKSAQVFRCYKFVT